MDLILGNGCIFKKTDEVKITISYKDSVLEIPAFEFRLLIFEARSRMKFKIPRPINSKSKHEVNDRVVGVVSNKSLTLVFDQESLEGCIIDDFGDIIRIVDYLETIIFLI